MLKTLRPLLLALACILAAAFLAAGISTAAEEGGAPKDGPRRVKHPSGLVVVLVEPGTGAVIEKGQTAVVHYTGWLDAGHWEKGAKFDSSRDRGQPFAVRGVGAAPVIKGWNDGIAPHRNLPGMAVGEKRRLLIPAHLADGARSRPKIPAISRLIFDVELLEIR